MAVERAGAGTQKARQGTQHTAVLRNSPSCLQKHGPILPPAAGTAATDRALPVLPCPRSSAGAIHMQVGSSPSPCIRPASWCFRLPRPCVQSPAIPGRGFPCPTFPLPTFPTVALSCHSAVGTASAARACSGHQPAPEGPLRCGYCAHTTGRLPRRCWDPVPPRRHQRQGRAGAAPPDPAPSARPRPSLRPRPYDVTDAALRPRPSGFTLITPPRSSHAPDVTATALRPRPSGAPPPAPPPGGLPFPSCSAV